MKVLSSALLATLLMASVLTSVTGAQNLTADRIGHLGDNRLVYINDTVLTAADFARYIEGSGLLPTGRTEQDLDTLESALEFMIDQWVITMEADTGAILGESLHNRQARWRMANTAGPLAFQHDILPIIDVPEAEVEQFYRDSLKTMFTAPEKREVRHLLISPKWHVENGKRVQYNADHVEARALADSLKKLIEAGASMAELARSYSADSGSRDAGGYLGWVFPNNTTYNFDTAAFAAELNDIHGPVKSIYGYHLIRVEGIRPESTIVLTDSLAAMIRAQLEFDQGRRLGNVWADSVIKAADWQYNDPWLEGDMSKTPDSMWVVVINGRDTLIYGEWKGSWQFFKRQMNVEGDGTLEEKHRSLRKSGFPYLYLHAAEDQGWGNHPDLLAMRAHYARSEQLRRVRSDLHRLQEFPTFDSLRSTLAGNEDGTAEMKLEMIRAADTAAAWGAYRALTAGKSMETVARWYHDDMREVRHRAWDLGWVTQQDVPSEAMGKVWILGKGRFTRPIEVDGKYYLYRLVDRRSAKVSEQELLAMYKAASAKHRQKALDQWRREVRAGHTIRRDPATWRRVVRLFRKW